MKGAMRLSSYGGAVRKGVLRGAKKVIKYDSSVFFLEGKFCFNKINYKLKMRKSIHRSCLVTKHIRYLHCKRRNNLEGSQLEDFNQNCCLNTSI